MKAGRLFWAIFFITLGVLGLLVNLSWFRPEWHAITKFWPVVLVLLGLTFLVRNEFGKRIIAGGAGLLAALILFVLFHSGWHEVDGLMSSDHEWRKVVKQEITESYTPDLRQANFSFESGAGKFTIGDTTSDLLSAMVESSLGKYELTRTHTDSAEIMTLGMAGNSHSFNFGRAKNTVRMRLNPAPQWDLDFDIGAADVDFDLSPYNARSVRLSTGASSIDLTMGDKAADARLDIEAGAASLHIRIPKSVDCEIHCDAALSSKDFDGFEEKNSGEWQTVGFGSAKKKLVIDIDAGVSSLRVERY